MTTSRIFRVQLARRIAALVAVSVAGAALGMSSGGCGSTGTSCGDVEGTGTDTQYFPWPEQDGGVPITTGAGGGGGGEAVPPCPSEAGAKARFDALFIGVVSVDSAGTFESDVRCCYQVTVTNTCEGRPFLV